MRTGFFLAREESGALHHNIHTQISPRQLGRITLRKHLHPPTAHQKGITLYGYGLAKSAMCRIVLKKVSDGRGIPQIIYGYHLKLILLSRLKHCTKHVTSDSAKTINCYFDRHGLISFSE
jgi:hypothetical protein